MLSLLAHLAPLAHITMNPNYGGGSGGYFFTQMKVPHGEAGMHTTQLVMDVPRGVSAVRPEAPPAWNVTVISYTLPEEEQYMSHGRPVTTAPDKVIWQATTPEAALYTDHLMMIGLQLKLGCSYRDAVNTDYSGSNSIWQGQRTLWFKVAQHSSHDDTLAISKSSFWSGALADDPATDGSPAWNPPEESGLKACPYIFIHAGTRCAIEHSGEAKVGGLRWMGSYVPPEANQGEVRHVQHALELANEAALNAVEGIADIYAEQTEIDYLTRTVDELRAKDTTQASDSAFLTGRVHKLGDDNQNALRVGLAALVLSALLTGVILGLCCFRCVAKESFARTISAVPLMSEHTVSKGNAV